MQRILIDNRDGYGLRDYTKFLWQADQFLREARNQPTLFDFRLIPVDGVSGWALPSRGSYVRFEDTRWDGRDTWAPGVIFTGYITSDPDYVFLGKKNGTSLYGFEVKATSEDYLLNSKQLPQLTFINKSRGYILRQMVAEMFKGQQMPFDTSGILEGGIERIYTVDIARIFTDVAAEFAKADGYVYRSHAGRLVYEPLMQKSHSYDPKLYLSIDQQDPRWRPDTFSPRKVATDIVNDVTVLGQNEPGAVVREFFISDGYQPHFPLSFVPYGVEEDVFIDDDLANAIDTGVWVETDQSGSYIQAFEGSLNVTGGPGSGAPASLLSRKGIELSGIIEMRDGEVGFAPSPTGQAYIGTLFQSDSLVAANAVFGWRLMLDATGTNPSGPALVPVGPGGVLETTGLKYINTTFSYILRKRIKVNTTSRILSSYTGSAETGNVYEDNTVVSVSADVVWEIEEIDTSDPEAIQKRKFILLSKNYSNLPDFALYAAVASSGGKFVLNSVKVAKPTQVQVELDGAVYPGFVGAYSDGGRAEIQVTEDKAKLAFYSVDRSDTTAATYVEQIAQHRPKYWWRMGQLSSGVVPQQGTVRETPTTDSNLDLVPAGSYTVGVTGALAGDGDGATLFNGTNARMTSESGLPFPHTKFTVEAWVKTSTGSTDFKAICSNRNTGSNGFFFGMYQGKALFHDDTWGSPGLDGVKPINDGQWHHLAVTYDGTTAKLYVDGIVEVTSTRGSASNNSTTLVVGAQNASALTYYWDGSIDELAIYDRDLTRSELYQHIKRGSYALNEAVTVPNQGVKVTVTYYREQQASARLKSTESILLEKQKFGDDGVRQRVVQPTEVQPSPKNSKECALLARAYLDDYTTKRYEGTYVFDTMEDNVTELRRWPHPGDAIRVFASELFDSDEQRQNGVDMLVENVSSRFLGAETYSIALDFGPVNAFETKQRQLLLSRRSMFEAPSLADTVTLKTETFQTEYALIPPDPNPPTISNVNAVYMSVSATSPSSVSGWEARRTDSGWCEGGALGGLITTATTVTFTTVRPTRDDVIYIKSYNLNGATKVWSRNPSVLRVAWPTGNLLSVGTVTGDINADRVRLELSAKRDRDFAGYVIRRNNSTGAIQYWGDGIVTREQAVGSEVYFEGGKLIVEVPNVDKSTAATFHIATVNLLGELGPSTTTTINRAVPVITSTPTVNANAPGVVNWAGTAENWQITVYQNNAPIESFYVPGDQTSYYFNSGGRDRTIEVAPADTFGTVTGSTRAIPGDTNVPSAPTLSVSMATSPSQAITQPGYMLSWTKPSSNNSGISRYEIEVASNSSFLVSDPAYRTIDVGSPTRPTEPSSDIPLSFFVAAQGVTRYFRVRAWNMFGNGTWSNISNGAAVDPLASVGEGYTWDPGNPTLRSDARAGSGGLYIDDVSDGSNRALTGFDSSARLNAGQRIQYGVQAANAGGTYWDLINSGMPVSTLSNGADVESGSTRALNTIDGSYRLIAGQRINSGVQMFGGVSWRTLALHGFSTVDDLSGGSLVTDGSTRARNGLNGSGFVNLKLPTSWYMDDGSGGTTPIVSRLMPVSNLSNGGTIETWAGLANSGFSAGGFIKNPVPWAVGAYDPGGSIRSVGLIGYHDLANTGHFLDTGNVRRGAARGNAGLNDAGTITQYLPSGHYMGNGSGGWVQIVNTMFQVNDLSNGTTVYNWASYANLGLDSSGNYKRNLYRSYTAIIDGGGTTRPLWMVGSSENTIADINDGGGYQRTTTDERTGAGRAYSYILSGGYYQGGLYAYSRATYYNLDLFGEALWRSLETINDVGDVALDAVTRDSLRDSHVHGSHVHPDYRASQGFSTGTGYDRWAY